MSEECRFPIRGPVATAAVQGRGQVIGRLEGGHHAPARRVTLNALGRRPPEDSLDVTPFADDLCVAAAQLESRRTVVEFDIRTAAALRLRGHWQTRHDAQGQHEGKSTQTAPVPHLGKVAYGLVHHRQSTTAANRPQSRLVAIRIPFVDPAKFSFSKDNPWRGESSFIVQIHTGRTKL
jgi:hypothetical protein